MMDTCVCWNSSASSVPSFDFLLNKPYSIAHLQCVLLGTFRTTAHKVQISFQKQVLEQGSISGKYPLFD